MVEGAGLAQTSNQTSEKLQYSFLSLLSYYSVITEEIPQYHHHEL